MLVLELNRLLLCVFGVVWGVVFGFSLLFWWCVLRFCCDWLLWLGRGGGFVWFLGFFCFCNYLYNVWFFLCFFFCFCGCGIFLLSIYCDV